MFRRIVLLPLTLKL